MKNDNHGTLQRNFITLMDKQMTITFSKKVKLDIRKYIKKIFYSVFYLLFLFYLIHVVQWYKRITNKQQYELMLHISSVMNSILSTISKIPILRSHFRSFVEQQNLNKSIVIEKYALYGTNILYHFIQVFKKGKHLYLSQKDNTRFLELGPEMGSSIWNVVSLVWSIQALPNSTLGKSMNLMSRKTNFILNLFGGNTRNNIMRKRIQYVHAAHVGFVMTCLQKLIFEGFVYLSSNIVSPLISQNKGMRINLKNYNVTLACPFGTPDASRRGSNSCLIQDIPSKNHKMLLTYPINN